MVDFQMYESLIVKSYLREYEVYFCNWQRALDNELNIGDVIFVDSYIANHYTILLDALSKHHVVKIEASESEKSFEKIGNHITYLLNEGFSRNNKIVAIGGGVVQDIVSFSASILFRGIDWIFIPTNLASQCDNCIGSKTSVNIENFKNQLGGFYPPKAVFIDFSFCNTLTSKEIAAGLGEMMHYFLLEKNIELSKLKIDISLAKNDKDKLCELIRNSLLIKKPMVELDEWDRGPRVVFNYGHTFGHAIESVTKFGVPHGIAVAYGIDLANFISVDRGYLKPSVRNQIRDILDNIWSGFGLSQFVIEDYFIALLRDKKTVKGIVKPILTKGVGEMFQSSLELNNYNKCLINTFFEDHIYMDDI